MASYGLIAAVASSIIQDTDGYVGLLVNDEDRLEYDLQVESADGNTTFDLEVANG